jgi:uncharacterized membrane protein
MPRIEHSIVVDAPLRTVYNQWTQFEEFPEFMEGVESVKQMDDKTLHWVAEVGGKHKEWDARITEQTPDQMIAWNGFGDADNMGVVRFTPIDEMRTTVDLALEYETDGVVEKVGDALGVLERRVEGDLDRFKDLVERRGAETGAWRGEIHEGRTGTTG